MSSRAYRLKIDEGSAAGVRRIAAGRADKALERLANADAEGIGAAIHGARKDLKKLRAVLRLVRGELGGKTFKAENRRYREAGRRLAGSRDAEVKLETLTALRDRYEGQLPSGPTERWAAALEAERDALAAAARSASDGQIAAARKAIAGGREKVRSWPLETDSWELVAPGLTAGYRDGRRAMKRVLANPSPDNVHEWRKRAKDLWYQLRIVQDAWPELLGETVSQADELADLLGDHHDLAVLREDLLSRPDLGDPRPFELVIAKRQDELLDRALEIGRRLFAEKPKAFRRRIGRYWLVWRER
jgi:CHAD domain-containing protein